MDSEVKRSFIVGCSHHEAWLPSVDDSKSRRTWKPPTAAKFKVHPQILAAVPKLQLLPRTLRPRRIPSPNRGCDSVFCGGTLGGTVSSEEGESDSVIAISRMMPRNSK